MLSILCSTRSAVRRHSENRRVFVVGSRELDGCHVYYLMQQRSIIVSAQSSDLVQGAKASRNQFSKYRIGRCVSSFWNLSKACPFCQTRYLISFSTGLTSVPGCKVNGSTACRFSKGSIALVVNYFLLAMMPRSDGKRLDYR